MLECGERSSAATSAVRHRGISCTTDVENERDGGYERRGVIVLRRLTNMADNAEQRHPALSHTVQPWIGDAVWVQVPRGPAGFDSRLSSSFLSG